jgi:hypothetical protein
MPSHEPAGRQPHPSRPCCALIHSCQDRPVHIKSISAAHNPALTKGTIGTCIVPVVPVFAAAAMIATNPSGPHLARTLDQRPPEAMAVLLDLAGPMTEDAWLLAVAEAPPPPYGPWPPRAMATLSAWAEPAAEPQPRAVERWRARGGASDACSSWCGPLRPPCCWGSSRDAGCRRSHMPRAHVLTNDCGGLAVCRGVGGAGHDAVAAIAHGYTVRVSIPCRAGSAARGWSSQVITAPVHRGMPLSIPCTLVVAGAWTAHVHGPRAAWVVCPSVEEQGGLQHAAAMLTSALLSACLLPGGTGRSSPTTVLAVVLTSAEASPPTTPLPAVLMASPVVSESPMIDPDCGQHSGAQTRRVSWKVWAACMHSLAWPALPWPGLSHKGMVARQHRVPSSTLFARESLLVGLWLHIRTQAAVHCAPAQIRDSSHWHRPQSGRLRPPPQEPLLPGPQSWRCSHQTPTGPARQATIQRVK